MPPEAPTELTAETHDGNGRTTVQTVALILIAGILATAAVTYLGPVFKPFLVAVFLYFLTKSVVDVLEQWRLPPSLAYAVLLLAAIAVGVVVTVFLNAQITQLGEEVANKDHQAALRNVINQKIAFTGYSLSDVEVPAAGVFGYVFDRSLETLELLGLAFFYLIFMILGAAKFTHRLHRAVPAQYAGQLFKISEEISRGMEEFIKVKTFVGLGMGITSAIILGLFGVKYWLLWGFLFFLLNYIHYIGSMAALLPPIVLAFVNFDQTIIIDEKEYLVFNEPIRASFVSVMLVLNRFVWIDFVEIRMSGERLNIEPVLIFLWLTYWGWMWGVTGLILAYPMLASLRIFLGHFESTRHWAVLMSEE